MGRTRQNAALLIPAVRSPRNFWRFLTSKDTPKGPKLAIIAATFYVLLPADLIPDIAPMIGWLDDVGAVTLAIGYVMRKFADGTRVADE